jgi:hypothetical protein
MGVIDFLEDPLRRNDAQIGIFGAFVQFLSQTMAKAIRYSA